MKCFPILLPIALASQSYIFQWETQTNTSSECNTPPDIVYSFPVSDPLKTTKAADETWPLIAGWSPFYPNKTCGQLKVRTMTDICCISVLTPYDFAKISSFAQVNVDVLPNNTESLFPSFMNGQNYCKFSNLGGKHAYTELYIKPDNECHESRFRCFSDGTFAVYLSSGCTGAASTFTIQNYTLSYNHAQTNVFQGQMVTISGAVSKVGYTQMIPGSMLTLSNREPAEILATIIYAILLVIELGLFCYFAFRYYMLKKFGGLLLAVAHFFWLTFICLIMAYNYKEFVGPEGASLLNQILSAWGAFFGLANLATAFCTANFIVIFWNFAKYKTFLVYASVVVVHISFMGGYYLYAMLASDPTGTAAYTRDISIWTLQIFNVWAMLLFIWDIVPICIIVTRATAHLEGSLVSRVTEAMRLDLTSSVLFLLQFPNAIAYLCNEVIRTSTSLLGNDRNYQASRSFSLLFVVLHGLLNTVIIYRVAKIVRTSQIGSNSYRKGSSGTSGQPQSSRPIKSSSEVDYSKASTIGQSSSKVTEL